MKSRFQNVPFCPTSALGLNFNPQNTTCIPACPVGLADRTGVVKIFAFLDLEQISVDFEIEHFETGSEVNYKNFRNCMIIINFNMSTTLPEAIFILSHISKCKKRAQICFL